MRNEERLRRAASAWLARLLAPDGDAARGAFEEWRAADPRHRDAYAKVERSWEQSRLLAHSPLTWNPVFPGAVRPRRRWRPVAAGLSVALAASVALVWLAVAQPPAGYATAIGEIRTVALPDGSRVTLDTSTRIRIDFSGPERRVSLDEGRARFAVVHDSSRPFVVTAGPAQVTDRGTVFDVRYRGASVDVVLLEGAVDVRPTRAARPVAPATLAPGQHLVVSSAPSRLTPAPSNAAARSWPSGMLVFEDSPLGDVLAEANRYSATPVLLGDPALQRLRVTGAFRAGSPAGLAQDLAAAFRLRVAAGADGRLVLMPPAAALPENGG